MKKPNTKSFLMGLIIGALVCSGIAVAFAATYTADLKATYRDIKVYVDDQQIGYTASNGAYAEPFIIDGTTYIPLRLFSEKLGQDVKWDGDTNSIYIGKHEEAKTMKMIIGNREVPVTWEDNASVNALREMLPLTVSLSMYGGFEQVGSIGRSITRSDKQTTTRPGDIILYSGNQIVLFYGSNSWSYTRLGHIDLSEQEMKTLLGNGDVTIRIEE